MCVCVDVRAWVGLDLEAHQYQWLHQPKHRLSYESCDVILFPQQTSHLDITFLLPVLHTSECMSHHRLLFIHFHPCNGSLNHQNIPIMTDCMAKEAPTVNFLVKYEVPTVVSNDNFTNVTVCSLIEAYRHLCGSCHLYHQGILCNPTYITKHLDHAVGGCWIP